MRISKVAKYLMLTILGVIWIFPIAWVVGSSLKPGWELFAWPPTLLPENPSLANFQNALQRGNFALYFQNSIMVSVAATVLTVFINAMAGYALAKFKFRGSNLVLPMFMATIMVPIEVIMVPIFIVLRTLGLYNSLWALIIAPAATPTGVFLIRQYLLSIPDSLMESACIDGAGEWTIFWKVIMPLAKPVLAVLSIFSFMWRWNDFVWPFIAISDSRKYTIQVAIANFTGQYSVDWNSLLAMNVLAMIPVVLVFIMFQRYFMRGIALSGMKN
ncbi:MAG TPA: sugar ABC transporter permease [Firmicutes bacterium]|nr:sugar ABC transporter permease [Bacillota bacterium]